MDPKDFTTIALTIIGFAASWTIWVSVSIFKHAEEISLLKQEIKVLIDVKNVLDLIRIKLID